MNTRAQSAVRHAWPCPPSHSLKHSRSVFFPSAGLDQGARRRCRPRQVPGDDLPGRRHRTGDLQERADHFPGARGPPPRRSERDGKYPGKNTRLVLSQPQVAPLSRSFPTPPPQAAKVPIEWEQHTISTHAVTKSGDLISEEALESVIRNKVGLKGALSPPGLLPHSPTLLSSASRPSHLSACDCTLVRCGPRREATCWLVTPPSLLPPSPPPPRPLLIRPLCDAHRQGPPLPQPDPPQGAEPVRERPPVQEHPGLQDQVRRRGHRHDPREHRGRVHWH
jgi:hypothetical protein